MPIGVRRLDHAVLHLSGVDRAVAFQPRRSVEFEQSAPLMRLDLEREYARYGRKR